MQDKTIFTIGHSNHPIEVFLEMLASFNIKHLADVRLLPGSNKFPQYNSDQLETSLLKCNIGYTHFKDLGGRRKPKPDSQNTGWKNAAFQGYADYMLTDTFLDAITSLEKIAENNTVVFMCSEAVWWSCHRSIIADYLKHKGWSVKHIMGKNKATEHPYTSPARIINGKLCYPGNTLFD